MKSCLLLTCLFFLANTLFPQAEIHFTNDSDTAFWYQHKNDNAKRFQLGLIENDTIGFSFRFWSSGLVIKVAGTVDMSFGDIVRFVEGFPNENNKKLFTKRYLISPSQASQVRNLIDSLEIEVLPGDKNIKGWQHGFDGVEYFTEFKKGEHYSFKSYWTPAAQQTLKEAVLFQSFVAGLDEILGLQANSRAFQNEIPFDSWKNPGSGTPVMRVKLRRKKKAAG